MEMFYSIDDLEPIRPTLKSAKHGAYPASFMGRSSSIKAKVNNLLYQNKEKPC